MSGLEMKYFILKPRSKIANDPYAKASRAALTAYAASIRNEDPELSDDLHAWAQKEMKRVARMEETDEGA